ncbi:MAG: hypothetical protein JSV92_02350 [archaeon]|nr:MAG: hypothetical protein JSV92_02350 [archaeon]
MDYVFNELEKTELAGKKIDYKIDSLRVEKVFEGNWIKKYKGLKVDGIGGIIPFHYIPRRSFEDIPCKGKNAGSLFKTSDLIETISLRILREKYGRWPLKNEVFYDQTDADKNWGVFEITGTAIFLDKQ